MSKPCDCIFSGDDFARLGDSLIECFFTLSFGCTQELLEVRTGLLDGFRSGE
jgi:hypothetical protein